MPRSAAAVAAGGALWLQAHLGTFEVDHGDESTSGALLEAPPGPQRYGSPRLSIEISWCVETLEEHTWQPR